MIYIKTQSGDIVEMGETIEIIYVPLPNIPPTIRKAKVITVTHGGNNSYVIARTETAQHCRTIIDWLWQQISAYGKQFVDINDCPGLND